MYYFLRQNLFEVQNIIEVTGHTEVTGKYLWTAGTKFPEDVPVQNLALDAAYGTRMADFFDTTIPLMSDRLLQTLYDAGVDNIDAYPMILERPDTGEKWHNYKAINVLGRIDAVDLENSEYELSPTGIYEFESIVIDEKVSGDALCFRLAKGPDLIVIPEKIADTIRKRDFVAVMLQRTEDYDGD